MIKQHQLSTWNITFYTRTLQECAITWLFENCDLGNGEGHPKVKSYAPRLLTMPNTGHSEGCIIIWVLNHLHLAVKTSYPRWVIHRAMVKVTMWLTLIPSKRGYPNLKQYTYHWLSVYLVQIRSTDSRLEVTGNGTVGQQMYRKQTNTLKTISSCDGASVPNLNHGRPYRH